ncbi:MAG: Ig-like domain-containing protein [Paludibacteraceae bacterium]|nr:Ig-like domain-containing protein [Paludibacteraceae bacterium]
MTNYKPHIYAIAMCAAICLIATFSGCANRGTGPQGGPKDTIAPVLIRETPLNGTCNFTGKQIVLQFDEYVQLSNVSENVLISPPQQTPPIVKAIGKKVIVSFEEPLRDSTTYTIDFGQAICDNNEKVPLGNYSFSFSTGEHIDTLAMFGKVINAEDLNPVQGVIVGVQEILDDSAFATVPFTRIAKSDTTGQFGVLNMRGGNYRIYALRDVSKDYLYQPSEALAFTDEIFSPALAYDSITTYEPDSTGVLRSDSAWYHVPDTIVLKLFTENKQRHYFIRALRDKEQHYFTLLFSAPQDTLPTIVALSPDSTRMDSTWVDFTQHMLCQANPTNDTLVYWLTDSSAISMDTLRFLMTYKMSDSLYQLVDTTDTVQAIYRHPRMSQKAIEAKQRQAANRKVEFKSNASTKFDIYRNVEWYSATPLADFSADSIHLLEKVDTILKPVPFIVEPLDSVGLRFALHAKLEPEHIYTLRIDSGAVHDIYGITNMPFKAEYKLRSLNEYSTLTIRLEHFDSRARIQILNEKDKVIREESAQPEGTKFEYLEAKSFYVRLYIDVDGNGQWTTGDWALKRQPEPVYYYSKKLSLRANWEFEESFDHLALPLLEQKPKALIKTETGKKK